MQRIYAMDWSQIYQNLNQKGYVCVPSLLSKQECEHLRGRYQDNGIINMERYRFGKGEYKYFNYPLPLTLQALREALYKQLAPIANEWMQKLNVRSDILTTTTN
jgi:hypothetical protein